MARSAFALHPQLALFQERTPPPQPVAVPVRAGLWGALVLPRLALEVLREAVDEQPWVAVQSLRGQSQVAAVSQPAQQAGIEVGMALSAAYALCPELESEERDEQAEQACLIQLADWACQYTSIVSLESQALLLELAGSLKLFGGLEALQARLGEDLQQLGHAAHLAMAPTPQAALLLARCGLNRVVTEPQALRATLGPLPLIALPIDERRQALLQRLGLVHLRDLWRLPAEGVRRRFGLEFSDYLDRLLGYKPEPRLAHQTAPRFSALWDFPLATDKLEFICHALEQLLQRLVRFMRLRGLALNHLQVHFYHPGHVPQLLELGTGRLCRDADHLADLLHERLDQSQLQSPVLQLELRAEQFHPFVNQSATLFGGEGDSEDPAWQQLLDQLQTRLGEERVSGLQLLADHRPERAWRCGVAMSAQADKARPSWLLERPLRLDNSLANICLLSEPERIEGGWWDDADVRRDYYCGRDERGRRLWLFQDLNDRQWYLHGLFG